LIDRDHPGLMPHVDLSLKLTSLTAQFDAILATPGDGLDMPVQQPKHHLNQANGTSASP
jgi:hypothetical protein